MNSQLDEILAYIENSYAGKIEKGARHYLEVGLWETARNLGYTNLAENYRTASAIVPLKNPQRGMKVRIDGRTFVNYTEYDSGVALPGYLPKSSVRKHRAFTPMESMICNF